MSDWTSPLPTTYTQRMAFGVHRPNAVVQNFVAPATPTARCSWCGRYRRDGASPHRSCPQAKKRRMFERVMRDFHGPDWRAKMAEAGKGGRIALLDFFHRALYQPQIQKEIMAPNPWMKRIRTVEADR